MGFDEVKKEALPDKVLKDCVRCPRQNACDEIAMYRGTLPKSVARRRSHAAQNYVQIAPVHV
jgi:amino-acid N-acetyltransferase